MVCKSAGLWTLPTWGKEREMRLRLRGLLTGAIITWAAYDGYGVSTLRASDIEQTEPKRGFPVWNKACSTKELHSKSTLCSDQQRMRDFWSQCNQCCSHTKWGVLKDRRTLVRQDSSLRLKRSQCLVHAHVEDKLDLIKLWPASVWKWLKRNGEGTFSCFTRF